LSVVIAVSTGVAIYEFLAYGECQQLKVLSVTQASYQVASETCFQFHPHLALGIGCVVLSVWAWVRLSGWQRSKWLTI
jgi:hypothetical protein